MSSVVLLQCCAADGLCCCVHVLCCAMLRSAAAAAEAAQEAAEAAAAAEAAERAASEAAAARASMKQQLRDSSCRYQLNLQGTAGAAPQAALGRQPQLRVSLTIHPAAASSSSSSTAAAAVAKVQRVYNSSDAATDGAAALAVQAAQQLYTHYAPAVAQGGGEAAGLATYGGAGGVQLSEADNMLWRLLLLAKIETAGRQAIGQVAPLAASGELQQDLQVCSHPAAGQQPTAGHQPTAHHLNSTETHALSSRLEPSGPSAFCSLHAHIVAHPPPVRGHVLQLPGSLVSPSGCFCCLAVHVCDVVPCRRSCVTVPCRSQTPTASSSDYSSVLTWRHSSSCLQPYSCWTMS